MVPQHSQVYGSSFFELLEEEFLEEGHHNRKRWREVSFITTDATAKLVTGGYEDPGPKTEGIL